MKVVKAGYKLIEEKDVIKKVERVARVCYKSEDKIGEGTDIAMTKKLVASKHLAMLEHASLAYEVSKSVFCYVVRIVSRNMHALSYDMSFDSLVNLNRIRYTSCKTEQGNNRYIISGNLRAWYELFEYIVGEHLQNHNVAPLMWCVARDTKGIIDWVAVSELPNAGKRISETKLIKDWSGYLAPERMIHETFSILFTCDRGVTHELVRMRDASFAQESTRYCNYSNGKYGSEITVIDPCFWSEDEKAGFVWEQTAQAIEDAYINLTSELQKPAQQARAVLPTSTKADIVLTSNLLHWRHIFELRACDSTGPAHPQMKEVMIPVFLEMKNKYGFAYGDLQAAPIWDIRG